MKNLIVLLALVTSCAFAQVNKTQQECDMGLCRGVGAPTGVCTPGTKYTQVDGSGNAPTLWQCGGIPPTWQQQIGGGGAAMPTGAVVFGTNPTTARAATGADISNTVSPSTQTTAIGINVGNPGNTLPGSTLFGYGAGQHIGTSGTGGGGYYNTFLGYLAGNSCTTCSESVAIGGNALMSFTGDGTGDEDGVEVAVGQAALQNEVNGFENVAVGHYAGMDLNNSQDNVIVGSHTMGRWSSGSENVVIGHQITWSLTSDEVGSGNVLVGAGILNPGSAGPGGTMTNSTVIGQNAAVNAVNAIDLVAVGNSAGQNVSGDQNTIIGTSAGTKITTATGNTLVGYQAGAQAFSTGSNNTVVGANAATFSTFNGVGNTIIGEAAGGRASLAATNNVLIGINAGNANGFQGTGNVLIGPGVGMNLSNASQSDLIAIGDQAAGNAAQAQNDIFIGKEVGFADTASNDIAIKTNCISSCGPTGGSNVIVGNGGWPSATSSGDVFLGGGTSNAGVVNSVALGTGSVLAASVTGAVQIGAGTNSASNTIQFQSLNFLDNGGNAEFKTVGVTVGTAIASAATIAPVNGLVHITGTAAIATITVPAVLQGGGTFTGCIKLIPDAAFTTVTTGNIALASTAVVGRVLEECYDGTKWYPSY